MYIPQFWCGVGLTFLVEMAALIIYGIYMASKDKGDE